MTTFKNTLSCIAISTALLCTASALASDAQKKEHRQHDAHEHGAAKLTIVSEGKELLIELNSPAANILGFEHAPENDQQKASIVQVGDILSNINNIITLPVASKCVLEHVEIKGKLFSQYQSAEKNNNEHHEEGEKHKENDDDHKEHNDTNDTNDNQHDDNHKEHNDNQHDDDHKEHNDNKHDDDHKEHNDNQHDDNHKEHNDNKHDDNHENNDHKEQSSHSDVSIHYELHCAFPEKITTLKLAVFNHFEDMHKIDVQAVIAEKQLAKQLTKKDRTVNF